MNHQEQIERLRSFEIDHEPDGWPGVRMRQISAMCDSIESLLAENERLNHNLSTTEQTMREYQELAAKRLEEIAKYRDAPVAELRKELERECCGTFFRTPHRSTCPNYRGKKPLIVKPGEEK